MPPLPANIPTDALSKWRLWEDQESLKEVVVALLLYAEEGMEEDLVVFALASKGDQYKNMKVADVNDIWRCIKEKADDPRNPYRKFLAAMKDEKGWASSKEIKDIVQEFRWYRERAKRAAFLQGLVDEAPGEGGS